MTIEEAVNHPLYNAEDRASLIAMHYRVIAKSKPGAGKFIESSCTSTNAEWPMST